MSAILKGSIAALLLGVAVGAYGFWEMSIQRRFDTEAVVVMARVGSSVPDGSGYADYHVVWYNDTEGDEHFFVVDIPGYLADGWGEARYGDQIEVEYLRTDPKRVRLVMHGHLPAWLWLVPAMVLLAMSLVGFSATRNWVTNADGTVSRARERV